MTKLQTALGFSPEQVAALPPPLIKIRELEQDNARLHRENDEMRRMLADPGGRGHLPVELGRRNSLSTFHDVRACDRDIKRRKVNGDEVYMVCPISFRHICRLLTLISILLRALVTHHLIMQATFCPVLPRSPSHSPCHTIMGTFLHTIPQIKAMDLRPCSAFMLQPFSCLTLRRGQVRRQALHSRRVFFLIAKLRARTFWDPSDSSLYSTPSSRRKCNIRLIRP